MTINAYHFWSPTCAPCKLIKPAVEDLKEEFSQIKWVSVNLQEDRSLSIKYNVTVVPTIVVEVTDSNGASLTIEKQSGTNIGGYYRIIRNALRVTQQ